MEKLKIKLDFEALQDPYVDVYDPDDNLIIRTNDDKIFLSICCQIKEAHAEGFYVILTKDMKQYEEYKAKGINCGEPRRFPIMPYGRVRQCNEMFHVYAELLRKLI